MKFQISAFSKREHKRVSLPLVYSRPSSYLRALSAQTGDVPRSQRFLLDTPQRQRFNGPIMREPLWKCDALLSRAAIKTEIISSTSDRITQDQILRVNCARIQKKREFYMFFFPPQTRANITQHLICRSINAIYASPLSIKTKIVTQKNNSTRTRLKEIGV